MISGTDSDTSAASHSKAVSLSQDSIFMATNGKVLPAKHILLPWVVKALTGSTEIIKILNRLGNSISLSKLEEIITALVVLKCGEGGQCPTTQMYSEVCDNHTGLWQHWPEGGDPRWCWNFTSGQRHHNTAICPWGTGGTNKYTRGYASIKETFYPTCDYWTSPLYQQREKKSTTSHSCTSP